MRPLLRCAAVVLALALAGCTGAGTTRDEIPAAGGRTTEQTSPTALTPTTDRESSAEPSPTTGHPAAGTPTARQVAMAVAAAKRVATAQHATVTSATATVGRGMVRQPNAGPPCTSGRVLHVTLVGTFPNIVVTGFFHQDGRGLGSTTVQAVLLTVDAKSGRTCLLAVQTRAVRPEPEATELHLR